MKLKFAEKLSELIEERKLSALTFSKLIDAKDTTILRWRKGLINPTIDKLNILCDFFDVTADYLLGCED